MNANVENTLRGWEVSLLRYGHIDSWNLNEKVNCIGDYLKSSEDSLTIRRLVSKIRDLVILPSYKSYIIIKMIRNVLYRVGTSKDENADNRHKKQLPGQRVRFKGQTDKLFDERLRFMDGRLLRNFDIEIETARDSKKVRRIVEKRMSQAYYKMNCKATSRNENSRNHRYWMQRATAFQLYNIGQVEHVKNVSRGLSTHWKRMYDPITGDIVFKKKMSYSSYDEAMEAIESWCNTNPKDIGKMQAYKCTECGKWHIGHKSMLKDEAISDNVLPCQNVYGNVC